MGSIDWNQFGGAPGNPGAGPAPAPAQKQKGGIDWSQFSGPAVAQASQQKAPAPAGSGWGDMWDAAKHHAGNMVYGAGQLLANGTAALAHKVDPGSDLDKRTAEVAARANADLANREKQYQARVPDSAWSYAGATAGEVAPFVFSAPGRVMEAAGDAATAAARRLGITGRYAAGAADAAGSAAAQPGKVVQAADKLAGNMVRGSAQTAAAMTVAPATTVNPDAQGGDYWNQKGSQVRGGAEFGAVLPVGFATAKGVYNAGRSVLAPFVNPESLVAPTLQNMAPGTHVDALVKALRDRETFVPGSMPTTAQVLQTPQAVMTEKAVSNTPAGKIALEARRGANNDARLQHIDQFAGTDADLVRAVAQRSQNAQPWTNTLRTAAPIDATPIVQHLDNLSSTGLGTDPVIRSAIADARKVIIDQATPGQNGGIFVSPDILDGVRQNMGGYLKKYASNGAVSSRQEAALVPLKNTIADTIDGGIPGYRDYLAAYGRDSVPVNTMEQIQGIRSNVDTTAFNASGTPTFTLNNARQAVKAIDRNQYPIAPEADAAMDNVLSDLQRESISNSVRAAGSDTDLNRQAAPWLTRQLYGDGITGKPAAGAGIGAGIGSGIGAAVTPSFGPYVGGATGAVLGSVLGWGGKKLADAGAQRVNGALVNALLNPDVAADIIQQQASAGANNQMLANVLRKSPLIGPYVNAPPPN